MKKTVSQILFLFLIFSSFNVSAEENLYESFAPAATGATAAAEDDF